MRYVADVVFVIFLFFFIVALVKKNCLKKKITELNAVIDDLSEEKRNLIIELERIEQAKYSLEKKEAYARKRAELEIRQNIQDEWFKKDPLGFIRKELEKIKEEGDEEKRRNWGIRKFRLCRPRGESYMTEKEFIARIHEHLERIEGLATETQSLRWRVKDLEGFLKGIISGAEEFSTRGKE